MNNKIIIILLLTVFNLSAQINTDLIITKEQSENWVENLKSNDLKTKIELINQRILADTNVYYIATQSPHGKTIINEKYNYKSYQRPLYVFINESGGKRISLSNNPKTESILKLTELISSKNILKIEVKNEFNEMVIYGTRGLVGLIIMTFKDDENIELIYKTVTHN